MEDRTEGKMISTQRRTLARMKIHGIVPKHQVLDNKVSATYKAEIRVTNMTFQRVPPNNHRRNIAKKAIQIWKDNFDGVLSGTVRDFPLHLCTNQYRIWNNIFYYCSSPTQT